MNRCMSVVLLLLFASLGVAQFEPPAANKPDAETLEKIRTQTERLNAAVPIAITFERPGASPNT